MIMKLCGTCGGTQIIELFNGVKNILAPCIVCASHRNLNDILRAHHKAEQQEDLSRERKRIREHNERLRGDEMNQEGR